MNVQIGGVISVNIYREDDKPRYRRGNSVLIAVNLFALALLAFAKVYYVRRNRARERIWSAMTADEKHKYLETTTDEGNKRLDFRFAH